MGFRNTVADAGSTGPVLPTRAASFVTSSLVGTSWTVPAAAQAGDIVLALSYTASSNGSFTRASISGFSVLHYWSYYPYSYGVITAQWKVLSGSDPGSTYQVNYSGLFSSSATVFVVLRGGDGVIRPLYTNFQQVTSDGGTAQPVTLPTGTRIKGDLIVVVDQGLGAPACSWPAAGSGGPPAPQPAFRQGDATTVVCNWESYADFSFISQRPYNLAYLLKAGA